MSPSLCGDAHTAMCDLLVPLWDEVKHAAHATCSLFVGKMTAWRIKKLSSQIFAFKAVLYVKVFINYSHQTHRNAEMYFLLLFFRCPVTITTY